MTCTSNHAVFHTALNSYMMHMLARAYMKLQVFRPLTQQVIILT